MKFERLSNHQQVVCFRSTNPIPFFYLLVIFITFLSIILYTGDWIVELERNRLIFAISILLALPLHLINSITRSETLTILPHGLQQTRTSLLFLSLNTFLPFDMINNVLINEFGMLILFIQIVTMHSVSYVLIVIKSENDDGKEGGIQPVFLDTRPCVDELEQVYHKVQSILFS
jgi:hypothetical protein